MKNIPTGQILTLLFAFVLLSAACSGDSRNSNMAADANSAAARNANDSGARTDTEALGMLINVPFESEDTAWKEDPAKKKITAVFRFSPEDAKKLIAEAEKAGAPQPTSTSSETWFPAELIAQSEMSGDDDLKGQAYPANMFFQEPYTAGRVIHIDNTDYFVLEVTSK
jgi:hypothetical protein